MRIAMVCGRSVLAFTVAWVGAGVAWGQTTFNNISAITCAVGTGSSPASSPGTACGVYPSPITVSGLPGTISNLQVRFNNLSVDREQDLIAVLVGPTGTNLILLSDAGSSTTTNTNGVTMTFSDTAANSIAQTTTQAFTTGSFRPSGHNTGLTTAKDNFPSPAPAQGSLVYPAPFGSGTLASQFNGIDANGTWSLYLIDDALGPPPIASGGSGVSGINMAGGWSLIITTQVASSPTGTVVTSSVNPSFTGNSVTFTATVISGGNPVTAGAVTFFADNVPISSAITLNGSGQASFATSALAQGLSVIRADYGGATGFGTSSGSLQQEVNNSTVITGNTFCNTGRIAVANDLNSPAARPYPSKLFVTGLSGTINNMTLQLKGLTGGRADDVELLLVGPNAAKFVVMNDVGGANAASNLNIDLNDGAANRLPDDTALSAGTFRPTAVNSTAANFPSPAPATPYNFAAPFGASTFAANYNGSTPNGTWQLFLVDDAGGGGTQTSLESGYCIAFTTTADPATSTTVTSSLNPSFTTAPDNSVTFTATVRNASTNALVTTGSVVFTEGATVLAGPVNLNASGQASFTTTTLSEGVHVITATYSGVVGQFNSSNGNFNQTVNNRTVVSGNQFCNPGPLTIPSSGVAVQYPSRIFVNGLSGSINQVTVSLNNLNGVRPDDLDVLLVGPTGAKMVVLSDAGGPTDSVGTTLTLDDSAANAIPDSGPITTGTFRPSSYAPTGDVFPSPAPAGSHNEAAPNGTATLATTFQGTDPNGTWQLFVNDDALGGPGAFTGGYCLNFTMAADLSLSKTHTGNFTQGQTGAQYTLTVSNVSNANAAGTISVVDTLPAGLTATNIGGSGWSCVLGTLTCSRNDGLAANSQFPPITLTVNVAANAPALVTNQAVVSGGGDLNPNNNQAEDNTVIVQNVAVTINTVPAGLTFTLNGNTFTAPQTFQLPAGSTQTLGTTTPQGGPSTRFVFNNWSDNGPISHLITVPSSPVTITGNFITQFQLTNAASPSNGGTVTPASGTFFDSGTVVNVTATANSGFTFANWTGPVANASAAATTVTMDAAKSITANFTALTGVTINVPAGVSYSFNGQSATGSQTFNVAPGIYTLSTTTPQSLGAGVRAVFSSWSNGLAIAHNLTVGSTALTITGNFVTQFQLTNAASPSNGGNVTPASGTFFDSGTVVNVTATASPGFTFANWTGPVANASAAATTVTMDAAKSVTANFTTSQFLLTTLVNNIGAGTGTVSPATGLQNAGLVNVTATPGACSVFTGWTGATVTAGQVNLTGPLTLTASFSAPVAAPAVKGSLQTIRGTPQRYRQAVSVLNTTGAPADISIIVDNFGGGVSVVAPAAPTGLTTGCTGAAGRAFYTVSNVAPGAYGTVTFDLAGPNAAGITYNASAVVGTGPR